MPNAENDDDSKKTEDELFSEKAELKRRPHPWN
jgi:hypothetical protein